MKDWQKFLLPILLSLTVGAYGISIIPRIERNERGIDRLIELVLEMKEDISYIKAQLEEHVDSSN